MADLVSSQSESTKSVASRQKRLCETVMSKIRHPLSRTSCKNSTVVIQFPFDPPLEAVSSTHHVPFKRTTDLVHKDHAGWLEKGKKCLQTEISKLQNRLLRKESALRAMKSKLDSYRERNARQSSQIWSLKGQVKDLEEINASAKRISTLKDISIEMLEKEKWVLRERISEHESLQRPKECTRCQCVSKWHDQHDLFLKEKEVSTREQMPFLLNWESKTTQTQCQSFIHHLAILLSNTLITVPATEEAVRERIQDIIADEQSWISKTNVLLQEIQLLTLQVEQLHQLYQEAVCDSPQTEEKIREQKSLKFSEGKCATDDFFQGRWDLEKKKGETQREQNKMKTLLTEELDKKFTQQEKEKSQQILLSAEQSLQNPTTVSLEEKMKKLKKELSEIKLSNETMKTQLRKVIKLKDKIMKKMRESLKMVEAFKENTAQTTDCTEQEAREDIEWPIPHKAPEEPMDFRETLKKMMGINTEIPDREIINQLKPILQAYEISLITSNSR